MIYQRFLSINSIAMMIQEPQLNWKQPPLVLLSQVANAEIISRRLNVIQALFANLIEVMEKPAGTCLIPSANCSRPAAWTSPDSDLPPTQPTSRCLLPQYHIFTFVLAMIALASFLKLHYIVKTAILLVMVVVYTALMLATFRAVFTEFVVCKSL